MKIQIYLSILIFSISTFAVSPFENFREGESRFLQNKAERDEILREYVGNQNALTLKEIMDDETVQTCGSKIVSRIKKDFNLESHSETKKALLGLRLNNLIDDVALDVLLKTEKLENSMTLPLMVEGLNDEEIKKSLDLFETMMPVWREKGICHEDIYRNFTNRLYAISRNTAEHQKTVHVLAYKKGLITKSEFKKLEMFRHGKVFEWPMTLNEYARKLKSLREAFPERVKDSSKYVTSLHERAMGRSLRQLLFEKYNSNQIMVLSNLMKNLQRRLTASKISIHIVNSKSSKAEEVLDLAPMEQFRFSLKMIRKELSDLNHSRILGGVTASYLDVIAASYETGLVISLEVDQLASLEEIWVKKVSKKEKVMWWVREVGGVASVFITPPYGFFSIMGIMLLDQKISDPEVENDPDFNLF